MRRTLALIAVLVLAGCIGGGASTPTATATPTETATPTPTPNEWERATAVSGTIYSGDIGDVTEYVRVEQAGQLVVSVANDRDARVTVAYSAEGEPPTTVTLRGGETHRVDVQPGAYGLEIEETRGGPVGVTVRVE